MTPPTLESIPDLIAHKRRARVSRAQNAQAGCDERREVGRTFFGLRRFGSLESAPANVRGCAWIEGEPSPGQRMSDLPTCGAKKQLGSSYCPHHEARAHNGKAVDVATGQEDSE